MTSEGTSAWEARKIPKQLLDSREHEEEPASHKHKRL